MRRAALIVLIAIATAGCAGGAGGGGLGSNGISQAQYDSVQTGESAAEVRSALGKPESISKMDMSSFGHSEEWTYSGPGDTMVMISVGQELNDTTFEASGPMVVQDKSIF